MQLFVSVAIFPLEAFTSHIKHCQHPTVVRRGYNRMDISWNKNTRQNNSIGWNRWIDI